MSDLFRRIRRATRASLNDLKRRTFGSEDKSLSELSDAELEEELLRRRRRRARGRSGGAPRREDDTPQAKQVLQMKVRTQRRRKTRKTIKSLRRASLKRPISQTGTKLQRDSPVRTGHQLSMIHRFYSIVFVN